MFTKTVAGVLLVTLLSFPIARTSYADVNGWEAAGLVLAGAVGYAILDDIADNSCRPRHYVGVPVYATVSNQGGSNISGLIPVQFRLDGVGGEVIGWANVTIDADEPLQPGASVDTGTITWQTITGTYDIYSIVDPNNDIAEENDANNF